MITSDEQKPTEKDQQPNSDVYAKEGRWDTYDRGQAHLSGRAKPNHAIALKWFLVAVLSETGDKVVLSAQKIVELLSGKELLGVKKDPYVLVWALAKLHQLEPESVLPSSKKTPLAELTELAEQKEDTAIANETRFYAQLAIWKFAIDKKTKDKYEKLLTNQPRVDLKALFDSSLANLKFKECLASNDTSQASINLEQALLHCKTAVGSKQLPHANLALAGCYALYVEHNSPTEDEITLNLQRQIQALGEAHKQAALAPSIATKVLIMTTAYNRLEAINLDASDANFLLLRRSLANCHKLHAILFPVNNKLDPASVGKSIAEFNAIADAPKTKRVLFNTLPLDSDHFSADKFVDVPPTSQGDEKAASFEKENSTLAKQIEDLERAADQTEIELLNLAAAIVRSGDNSSKPVPVNPKASAVASTLAVALNPDQVAKKAPTTVQAQAPTLEMHEFRQRQQPS